MSRENSEFVVVNIEQGSFEWLEWRQKGIGASDAPVIMKESRYRSLEYLIREKQGPIERNSYQNDEMALGKRLEPEALRSYIDKTGKVVKPACVQNTRYDWLRASLDGINASTNYVVEIKCGASVYQRTSKSRSIPSYYYAQVQHILAVTGYDSLDFWCYWPGCPELLLVVERNQTYIQSLLEKEHEFWNKVIKSNNNQIKNNYNNLSYKKSSNHYQTSKKNNNNIGISSSKNPMSKPLSSQECSQYTQTKQSTDLQQSNSSQSNEGFGCLFIVIGIIILLALL